MGYSPLCTSIQGTTDNSARTSGPLNMIVLHHAATTDLQAILTLFQPGGRQVSAHLAVKDGQRVGAVVEERRAWSLADAYWDSRAFTVECANESTAGWTISQASHESLAQLCADWAKRYGFPIVRTGDPTGWTLLGHREVYTIHGGSYATACPGGMNLDWIAQRANEILNPKKEEVEMSLPEAVASTNGTNALVGELVGQYVGTNAGDTTPAVWSATRHAHGQTPYPSAAEQISNAEIVSLVEAGKARYAKFVADVAAASGGATGGLTAAQDAKVMGSAQADKVAVLQTSVSKIPTTPATYVPQSPA